MLPLLLLVTPTIFYTLWEEDPLHTVTCVWRDEKKMPLEYSQDGHIWIEVEAQERQNRFQTTILKGLNPGTEYLLRCGDQTWKYQTPQERSFKAIIGGDIYQKEKEPFLSFLRMAIDKKPSVIILGGDLAYAGSKWSLFSEDEEQWITFLTHLTTACKETLIPFVAAVGNHDVCGRYDQTPEQAKGFYHYFRPHHSKGYQAISIGDTIRFLLLDTNHTTPIQGEQTQWLDKQFTAPFTFAIYHIPAFPSVRSFDNRHSKEVRQHFVPLFEKHHLKAAFEHHEHAYKRTKPINGVTYLGDGCWGVKNKRHPQANDSFAHTASTYHVFLLTIDNTRCTVEALAPDGTVFDSVTLD